MLKYLIYDLREKQEKAMQPLIRELEQEGIFCRKTVHTYEILEEVQADIQELIFITDDRTSARQISEEGAACIGVTAPGEVYFDGAELVLEPEAFDEIDRKFLDEYLQRVHGIPVTIARTEHLILREFSEEDCKTLEQIASEQGMEQVLRTENGTDGFEEVNLRAYIRHQYRLYGYGLWGVFLKEDESLIGCCGFEAMAGREADELELEYMLAAEYCGKGYGTEMCRAAVSYADERLDAERIWVRVHPQNGRAQKFAQKLSIERVDRMKDLCEDGTIWYMVYRRT